MASLISALIFIVVAAIVVHLVLWVLGEIGAKLPAQIIRLVWVIFVLLVLLYLYRTFGLPSP